MASMKRCSTCKELFPLTQFGPDKRTPDGLQYQCLACRRFSARKYSKTEKFRVQQRRYRQSEKGKHTARLQTQRRRQTEAGKRYEQLYRRSERRKIAQQRYGKSEKAKQTKRLYWQTEKSQKRMQRYREMNKEQQEAYIRIWLQTPQGREYMARRNFTRRTSVKRTHPACRLTVAEWQAIKEQFHNACAYCGIPESASIKLTRDHLIPVSKSGLHTKDNIVPACQVCNSRKGAKIITDPAAHMRRKGIDRDNIAG